MRTWVMHSNPMRALTNRYAVVREGHILDRKSTREAALRRAIFFCRQDLETRLNLDPVKWAQIVATAKQDETDARALEMELQLLTERRLKGASV